MTATEPTAVGFTIATLINKTEMAISAIQQSERRALLEAQMRHRATLARAANRGR